VKETTLRDYRELLHAKILQSMCTDPRGLSRGDILAFLPLSTRDGLWLIDQECASRTLEHDFNTDLYASTRKCVDRLEDVESRLRRAERAQSRRRAFLLAGATLFALSALPFAVFYWASENKHAPSPPATSLPSVLASPANFDTEAVDARIAGAQRQRWRSDAAALANRRMTLQAARNPCTAFWQNQQRCYVGGQRLTEEAFDDMCTDLEAEELRLRRLLAASNTGSNAGANP
jgi:hypothetical protein